MHLTYRQTCRVCASKALVPAVDLGEQHIQGVFSKPSEAPPPLRKVPLKLVRCDPEQDEHACGLLQTALTVPPEILYHRYWYRSGTNTTMREHLRSIAEEVRLLIGDDASVLDIGSNDGTLLSFLPETMRRVAVDPSDAIEQTPEGITRVRDLFPSPQLHGAYNAIIAVAMFYDLEDPIAFANAVRERLLAGGVFVFEMAYMPTMLRNTSYDTICHEHIEYYSLATIERILAAAGLKVARVQLNDSNGGSIRVWATHIGCTTYDPWRDSVAELRRFEFDLELDTPRPYEKFMRRVQVHRDLLQSFLSSKRREGARIHIYGASTKGNTILQYCGIGHETVECAADRNPDKWGASIVGSGIPIVSEEESRAMRPNYYLVLPWHFRREFVQREAATVAAGTCLIFPLPEVSVVGASNIAAEEVVVGSAVH